MQVLWGSISGSDDWQVKVGDRVVACESSADAYLTAQRQGFRRDRLRRVVFPPVAKAALVVPDPEPAPVVEPDPEPTPEPEVESAPEPAFDADAALVGRARDIADAIEAGEYDAHLDSLHAAESEGKARKTVLRAIDARRG